MSSERSSSARGFRFDRAGALERSVKSLTRALELHDGSFVATQAALWEVESVRKRLPEIEASLRSRLDAIKPLAKLRSGND